MHSVLKGSGSTATFTYDNNGNLLSGDGKSIVYNTDNKPIRIESPTAVSTLVYGADGMRVKQVNSSARGVETTRQAPRAPITALHIHTATV
ncbi:hypothetical protein [Pseudidiomarina donghaiensis]|uniref:RHS repeat protein n=1 Tax=Pseudidiomarina donghaiensis TaxID=519452 RepID=A0A432XD93_9GAMM|nr:hypothetical protein [Pseudidiomarina donghaiensis]RUO46703.1 hypothetical protein CWE24_10685 [Pseudidiomarina donghaiensis]